MQRGLMSPHEVAMGLQEAIRHEEHELREYGDSEPDPWRKLLNWSKLKGFLNTAQQKLKGANSGISKKDFPSVCMAVSAALEPISDIAKEAEQYGVSQGIKAGHHAKMAYFDFKYLARETEEAVEPDQGDSITEANAGTQAAVKALEGAATFAKEAAEKVKAGNYSGAIFKLASVFMEARDAAVAITKAAGKGDASKVEKATKDTVYALTKIQAVVK